MPVKKSAKKTATPDKPVVFSGITISHPDRIVYPISGLTKADVVAYYDAVADYILPYLQKRPLSLIRCPDGLKARCFFQRHVEGKSAEYLTQLPIVDSEAGEPYFSVDTKKALLSMVQFGVVEFHPWGSKGPQFDKPNQIIFDLDPDPRIDWDSVKTAAVLVKDRLEKIGLKSFIKTTGGKGLHVVAPITPKYGWDVVKPFTKAFVQSLENEFPQAFVTTASKAERKGKIYLDYLRNDETSTAVAPFSLRARRGEPVSMPLHWKDLKKVKSGDQFNMTNVLKTLRKNYKDPWADFAKTKQQIPKSWLKNLP